MLSEIHGGAPWFTYTYDKAGNMTQRRDVYNGVNDSTNALYDELNRPTMWEQTGAGNAVFARSWQKYDKVGRLAAIWRDEDSSKGEKFGYNAMSQVTSAVYHAEQVWNNPVNPRRTVTLTYTADSLNRQSVTDNGTVTNYAPNDLNQYVAINGQALAYDQNFNLYTLDGWRYDYDAAKQLLLTTNGPNTGEFVYDGLGRCVKRRINGITTVITYDGWKPTVEWNVQGNLAALNLYGPGPDEILYRYDSSHGERFRYHLDRMGNVVFLLDCHGGGLEKYTYDAFGKPKIYDWQGNERSKSAFGNRFMFTGREYTSELGIYDYRHRMYHPGLGRFLQTDPIGLQTEGRS